MHSSNNLQTDSRRNYHTTGNLIIHTQASLYAVSKTIISVVKCMRVVIFIYIYTQVTGMR